MSHPGIGSFFSLSFANLTKLNVSVGIACILMVLRWLRPIRDYPFDSSLLSEELENRKILLDNIGTKSIWTADLVLQIHQLFEKQRTAKYLFCSKIMGVDGNYQDVRYYRAAFGSDQARLSNTFKELDRLGASTFCTPHIPLTSILNLVSHEDCLAIVLVDNSALVGSRGVRDIVGEDQYIGHYVILCGISTDKESLEAAKEFDGNSEAGEDHCLVMYNPGHNNPRIMFVTPSRFQRARSAKGTDEDIIFIFRQSSDAGQDYTDPFIDSKKTKT